jgi:hypothetical protein
MSNTSKVGHHINSTTHLKSKQVKFHLKQNPLHLHMYFKLKFCPSKLIVPSLIGRLIVISGRFIGRYDF